MSVRVHHLVSGPGDAPALVLSNSLGTSLEMWDEQVEALAERFRVVRYDTRGHGRSDVPEGPYSMADLGGDVVGLLDDLGVERAHFCGISMGAMTGMWVALHAPERVDRLVLGSASRYLGPPSVWGERVDLVRSEGMEALADPTIDRWFTPGALRKRADAVERIRQGLLACPVDGYAACCEALAGHDVRGRLGAVDAPTLVLVGDQDETTTPSEAREIAAEMPDARVDVLSQSRHLFNVERPARATRAIMDHLS